MSNTKQSCDYCPCDEVSCYECDMCNTKTNCCDDCYNLNKISFIQEYDECQCFSCYEDRINDMKLLLEKHKKEQMKSMTGDGFVDR